MGERLVLTLDGSTDVCTAALLALGPDAHMAAGEAGAPCAAHGSDVSGSGSAPVWRVVDERTAADGKAQARVLLQLIDEMLTGAGAEPQALAAIVVGTGPGTFTGVRITVATARALALALGVPVFGASSLAALAAAAVDEGACGHAAPANALPGVVVPVIDARRGQIFYGVYTRREVEGSPVWSREEGFAVCDRADVVSVAMGLAARAQGGAVVCGDASLWQAHAPGGDVDGVRFRPAAVAGSRLLLGLERLVEPAEVLGGRLLSQHVAAAVNGAPPGEAGTAAGQPAVGQAGSPEAVKPIYVRAPDADIHITKMRDPWKSS